MSSPGRRAGAAHRKPTHRDYLRRRLAATGALALLVVVLVAVIAGGASTRASKGKSKAAATPVPPHSSHLQVAIAPWQLPAPLSRTVALAVDGNIDVFGGLIGTGSTTTASVMQLDPANGHSENVATLPVPVHDAAGAGIGSHYFVFGGGATQLTTSVQSFAPDTAAGTPATSIAGQLPAQRADLAAAAGPDGTVYLAGGYDGTRLLPDVLSTHNGTSFTVVAQLPVPVRYPAVAVADGKLWVVGGDTGDSTATDAIQTVDLKTHAASVAGHLPEPISHAVAAQLGNTVYLFGGRSGGNALDTVLALDAAKASFSPAGSLPLPGSDMAAVPIGETVYLIGGEGQLGQPGQAVVVARLTSAIPTAAASGAPPFTGQMLIADRGNNRLLLVTADKKVQWIFPSLLHPAPPQGFYFPDDAFFTKHGTGIITNEEDQNTILEIAFPSGQVIGSYGHPNQPGSSAGYLNQPDDAYLLPDGKITVADAKNCRILFLNPDFTYLSAIGHTGRCQHDIPNDVAYPNGDTPLQDGNFLVSEIDGSYIDEVTMSGQVVWSVKLPLAYVSDPQQLGPDLYLVADYTRPGGIYEFTREGQIVWSYTVGSGEGMLDHPSLAERLPSGVICANDDYRDRVVCINPTTKQIVWQYGDTDTPGTAPGMLKIPDGFDLLEPDKTTPTHPFTG
jgi:N-acetylneuraminic acid mutarotase